MRGYALLLVVLGGAALLWLGFAWIDRRIARRRPEREAKAARAHAELELVEEFDRVSRIRPVPVGDLTWTTTTGDVYLVECDAPGCDVWFSPYADEEHAVRARDRHVAEHVRNLLGPVPGA